MKTGIGRKLDPNRRSKAVEDFERSLHHLVIGQDPAVESLIDIFQMFTAGLNPPRRPVGTLLFLGPTGTGKCLAPKTPILMFDGSTKFVEEITVGDLLMGSDSMPRKVLSLAHGWDEMYDIVPVKGDTYRVNKPHILSLVMTPNKPYKPSREGYIRHRVGDSIVNLSVEDYVTQSKTFKHRAKGYRVSVDWPEKSVPVDPYFLGVWLGDGNSRYPEITSIDTEVIESVYDLASAVNMGVSVYDDHGSKTPRYRITAGNVGHEYMLSSEQIAEIRSSDKPTRGLAEYFGVSKSTIERIKRRATEIHRSPNPILRGLQELGVLDNKHVPLLYKANDRNVRLQLLAGLMDSDGSYDGSIFDFISKNARLSQDVAFVARSLGFAAYVKECEKVCTNSVHGRIKGRYYRVSISGNLDLIPTRVERKKALPRKQKKDVLRTGIEVKPAGYGEYFGFELDGDGLFLLGDFTVTHNTKAVESAAEVLFGDPGALLKIDCGEFQHSHEIAKLIGSPPGYLGHRETHPVLNQDDINKYHTEDLKLTFLLFDEIEKASDALWQLLLGILDKGTITLGNNSRVDMSSCIIVMTSNIGAAEMSAMVSGGLGFSTPNGQSHEDLEAKIQRTAIDAARRKFSPEFMNRIDKSVVFKTLRQGHLEQILELELEAVQNRIFRASDIQFFLTVTNDVKKHLLKEGTDPKYGARHLKRSIERHLVFPLSNLVATEQINVGDSIRVSCDREGHYVFTVESDNCFPPMFLAKVPARKKEKVKELLEATPGVKKAIKTLQEAEERLAEAQDRKRKMEINKFPNV